ncbi:hypothetical protein KAU18_06505 [Candidatus Bathyarchaeota archaeon]|nr:hypothetical protein [Candidatus Bathyarchaeota archaeon]
MKDIKRVYLNIAIGIIVSLFIFELIYVHPVLVSTVFDGSWSIVDEYGNDLGNSFIELQVMYTPNPLSSSIGEFSFPIKTHLINTCEQNSVILGDTLYEIDILYNNKLVEKVQGRYLGTVNNNGTFVYNVVLLPRNQYTFKEIRHKYGLINLDAIGRILNHTSGKVLISGSTKLIIFIMYPYTKIITFVLLMSLIFLRYL